MKKSFVAGATLAAVALSGAISMSPARADLTYQGAVGLPLNPTAQIPELSGVRVQGNYFDLGGAAGGSLRYYSIVGAGRAGDRIEVNGGITRLDGSNALSFADETSFAIGAKYLFTRESDPQRVRLAAGAGYDRALIRNLYAYGVATKSFGRGISEGRRSITGHLGLRYDRFDSGSFGGDQSNKLSVYGGVEVPVAEKFTVVGELQSKKFDGGSSPYSLSVRYRPQNSPFGASVGIQRQGVANLDSGASLFAQVGYSFGGGRSAQDETTPVVIR